MSDLTCCVCVLLAVMRVTACLLECVNAMSHVVWLASVCAGMAGAVAVRFHEGAAGAVGCAVEEPCAASVVASTPGLCPQLGGHK